jgi:hypothetical protein
MMNPCNFRADGYNGLVERNATGFFYSAKQPNTYGRTAHHFSFAESRACVRQHK